MFVLMCFFFNLKRYIQIYNNLKTWKDIYTDRNIRRLKQIKTHTTTFLDKKTQDYENFNSFLNVTESQLKKNSRFYLA